MRDYEQQYLYHYAAKAIEWLKCNRDEIVSVAKAGHIENDEDLKGTIEAINTAISALEKIGGRVTMTNCEAIAVLKTTIVEYPFPYAQCVWDEAIDMAISALEKQEGKGAL